MSESSEVRVLQQLILDDERTIEALHMREAELIAQIESQTFRSTRTRQNLLHEVRLAEKRLHSNRKQLLALNADGAAKAIRGA